MGRQEIIDDAVKSSRDRRTRTLMLLLGALAILGLVTAAVAVWIALDTKQKQVQAGNQLANQVHDACKDGTIKAASTGSLCEKAKDVEKVTGEQGPRGAQGAQGAQGEPGATGAQGPAPTAAQVRAAVVDYCSGGACTQGPTQAQVADAVAAYCAGGKCTGPAGKDGAKGDAGAAGSPGPAGTNGENGEPGAQGPGPDDAQVQAAVAAYCDAHNGCAGPAGADGSQGPQGEPGASGAPAYPFEFTFTIPKRGPLTQDRTYHCRIDDPATPAECEDITSQG